MSGDQSRSDDRNERGPDTSRRRFLAATGAAGLVGATGFALGQETTTFELGGNTPGWEGRSPDAIADETNPTLSLQAGMEYEVVWENVDGAPHDFVIDTEGGETLVESDTLREEGETASVTFTATTEMNRYVCTFHPNSMAGNVTVSEEGDAGETETPGPDAVERFVPEGPTVGAELVADGPLVNPVTLRTVPGEDDTHLIVDQAGLIYVLDGDELTDEPFLDVSDDIAFLDDRDDGFDERGLLGMDLHPEFEDNDLIYVRYSSLEPVSDDDGLVGPDDREFPDDWDHVEVLSEFELDDGNGLAADPDSERVLLEVPESQFNHNGGEVTFGPDGYLYTSLGDGGDANDTGLGHEEDWYDGNEGGNAQNVEANLLGKILRIDVDSETAEPSQDGGGGAADEEGEDRPYAIPDDNPLVDTDGYDEIYAWGLRNPWRMSFNAVGNGDGGNGENGDDADAGETLITADVGQALFEEVDVIEAGGNYGWNVREGFHCFDAADATSVPDSCPTSAPDEAPYDGQDLLDPVLEYPHSYQGSAVGISISGGYVYQGGELSDLAGRYVFGDWSANFAEPAGSVYVATMDDGEMDETDTPTPEATETAGEPETGTPEAAEQTDLTLPDEQPWTWEEVLIGGGENQRLNRFVQAFGRDADGAIYVLASRTGRLTSEAGEVYRLVPEGEGEEIETPDVPMEDAEGEGDESAGNETNGNGMAGNETMGNETVGDDTPDNDTGA